MIRSSNTNKFCKVGKKKRNRNNKSAKPLSMAGLDHGCPHHIMLITAPEYNDNLRAAEIIGCAYGYLQSSEFGRSTPSISLVVKNIEPIKNSFLQFNAWIDETGPDALSVEIIFNGSGYDISFSPTIRHVFWRTCGIGVPKDVITSAVSYVKHIDSRHEQFEQLAEYSSKPIAPVYLNALHFDKSAKDLTNLSGSDLSSLEEIVDPILLYNINVYRSLNDIPNESVLAYRKSLATKDELDRENEQRSAERISPAALGKARQEQLAQLLPATMHRLQRDAQVIAKVAELADSSDLSLWQVEQAVCNQRLWSLASSSGRYKLSKPKKMHEFLYEFIEFEMPSMDCLLKNDQVVVEQARKDARALLLQVDPEGECSTDMDVSAVLRKLGYLGGE